MSDIITKRPRREEGEGFSFCNQATFRIALCDIYIYIYTKAVYPFNDLFLIYSCTYSLCRALSRVDNREILNCFLSRIETKRRATTVRLEKSFPSESRNVQNIYYNPRFLFTNLQQPSETAQYNPRVIGKYGKPTLLPTLNSYRPFPSIHPHSIQFVRDARERMMKEKLLVTLRLSYELLPRGFTEMWDWRKKGWESLACCCFAKEGQGGGRKEDR